MSMNSVSQKVPRAYIAESITEERVEGYPTDPRSLERQFQKFGYPAAGHSRVRMMYKYGGSHFSTVMDSNRLVRAYQSQELEFVVNQSIWDEGAVKFDDFILPACTPFARGGIGEWAVAGGYSHHNESQLNHRVITMQHKCIEPLGESRSDFQIFLDISKRIGLGAYFAQGMTELDWCKLQFEASDLKDIVSWKEFLKKGYYVVPAEAENLNVPVGFNWYAEGRKKDTPEPAPLPSEYGGNFGEGLQTQSGKFEFEASSLKNFGEDPERPPINRYIPSWEGLNNTELSVRFPLQLITPHPRYSFHTHTDGKDSTINDIEAHRVLIDDHYYWPARINPEDARERGIAHHDLVRLFNDRGDVICAAVLTERILPGVIHSYESSAVYDPIGEPGLSPERGGCVNQLTSARPQTAKTTASAPNSCLIQVEQWRSTAAD